MSASFLTSGTGEPGKRTPSTRATNSGDAKPAAKDGSNHSHLEVPLTNAFRGSLDTISDVSIYSADNENERSGRLSNVSTENSLAFPPPTSTPASWKRKIRASWTKNKGLALVMLAQLFGVMMNVTTRLLEMSGSHGPGMHPFQVRPLTNPPSNLLNSRELIDLVCPNDWDFGPQPYVSVACKGRRCSLWP